MLCKIGREREKAGEVSLVGREREIERERESHKG